MPSLPSSPPILDGIVIPSEVISRFWAKVQRASENECWNWTACRSKDAYGNLRYGLFGVFRKNRLAHRFAYILSIGPIPEGLCVCHSCDNTACCNPAHFFLGTNADNMDDKCKKNRQSHCGTRSPNNGEASPHAKLTDAKVREIREIHAQGNINFKALAKDYGVAYSLIARVVNRQSWKHVE